MGKYLPGRILGYGYLIIHYNDAGRDKKRVLNSSFYELMLSTISAFIFFTITLCFFNYKKLNEFRYVFILISVLSIIALHPYPLNKILNYIFKLLKKDKYDYKITYSKLLKFLLFYLCVWILWGIAFFFFVNSFVSLPINNLIYISGVFAASTFVGFMAFILPAGLGARESMLIYFLTSLLGFIPSVVVSIGSRIWMICGDTVLFIAVIILSRLQNKKVYEK
jgi:hypothetical protein